MATVEQLNEEEFQTQLTAGGVMLVDFFADWCMPCKRMAPVVERLADTFEGKMTVAKVNVDTAPQLAQRYGIQSIPALLVFHEGDKIAEFIGGRPYETLVESLNSLL